MSSNAKDIRSSVLDTLRERGVIKERSETIVDAVREHGIPDQFTFRGIPLTYPWGRDQDMLKGVRLERLNAALVANNNKPILPKAATIALCKRAYEALWNKTRQSWYDPTPVPQQPTKAKVKVEHVTRTDVRLTRKQVREIEEMEATLASLGGR